MDEIDVIQASLASFTQRYDEALSNQFNELRKCSFFDPIPSEWLSPIAQQAEIKTFARGATLTTEGDNMTSFYVILFGSATAFYKGKPVGIIRSGECLGEGVFFTNETLQRSATVIANDQLVVAELKNNALDHIQGDARAHMNKALLLALFKKLQAANRKIEELLR